MRRLGRYSAFERSADDKTDLRELQSIRGSGVCFCRSTTTSGGAVRGKAVGEEQGERARERMKKYTAQRANQLNHPPRALLS